MEDMINIQKLFQWSLMDWKEKLDRDFIYLSSSFSIYTNIVENFHWSIYHCLVCEEEWSSN